MACLFTFMVMKKKTNKEKKNEPGKVLPGYPHYPPSEDLMNVSQEQRLDVNVDELSSQTLNTKLKTQPPVSKESNTSPEIVPGTEADVTAEDLQALGSPNRSNDGGDDELLPLIELGDDLTGEDLDVPASEDDDEMEDTGSEDEENNYYSRGQE